MRARVIFSVAVIIAALGVAVAGVALGAPKQAVDVKATLRGVVQPEGLAKPGDEVSEGAPLVYVTTQTSRAVAARAPVDGRVMEVFVRPGTVIRELGTVVVRLDPK